jgi:hypothetical protein
VMLKRLLRKIFYKESFRPLPSYGYQFISVDYDNWTSCTLTAHCTVTNDVYHENIIVPCNLKIFLRNRSRMMIVKRALCELMNDRLGVKVEAPKI